MATQQHSRSTLVAVGVLSGATALCLARVFRGWGWLVPCVGAAIGAVVLGAVCDRGLRRTPLTVAALVLGGAIVGLEVSEPGSTAAGVPSATALTDYRHDLSQMFHVLHAAAVPVRPIGTPLLLGAVAAWLMGSVAYLCATRFAGSLAALIAPLTVFVTVSALGRGAQAPTTAAFGAGVACFLLAQQRATLTDRRGAGQCGVEPRRAAHRRQAVIATAVALAAALIAGPTLPGARSAPLIDYRRLGGRATGPGSIVVVTPLVDIRDRLQEDPAQELFTVATDHATYWRIAGLDEFDGNVWEISNPNSAPIDSLQSEPPSTGHVQTIDAQFDTSALAGPWVPVPFRPSTVDLHGARVLPGSDTVIIGSTRAINATYNVVAEDPAPTARELSAAPVANDAAAQSDLQLPRLFPNEVRQIALSVTVEAHAKTPYAEALALQNYLRGKTFRYSLDVPKGHSDSALLDFLTHTHAGFCEQFSSAFAAMARSIGLPTRVAVGFTPGERDPAGTYHVSTQDAHAWPEVDFAGLGWIRFEPTPGRFDPTPGDYTQTGGQRSTQTTVATTPNTTAPASAPGATAKPPSKLPKFELNGAAGGSSSSGRSAGAAALRFVLVLLAVLLALVLGAAGSIIGMKTVRRIRRRRAPTPGARVIGAWDEALERLAEARIHRRPSSTPVEFAIREAPASGAGGAGPPLLALAHLTTSALYSPEEPSDADADDAWTQVRTLEGALRAHTAWRARLRRRLDPRVLRGSLPGDTETADDDALDDDALVAVMV